MGVAIYGSPIPPSVRWRSIVGAATKKGPEGPLRCPIRSRFKSAVMEPIWPERCDQRLVGLAFVQDQYAPGELAAVDGARYRGWGTTTASAGLTPSKPPESASPKRGRQEPGLPANPSRGGHQTPACQVSGRLAPMGCESDFATWLPWAASAGRWRQTRFASGAVSSRHRTPPAPWR